MLGEFLFRRLLGLTYAIAFTSFLSTSDGMFACSGLVPSEPRLGIPAAGAFLIGIVGLAFSIMLLAFNCNFTLVPLWILFLACNVMGTGLLFFREYDILLLEVGLYAILFVGDVGKQMASWALFRYSFAHALSFISCEGGSWSTLTWFKHAFTSAGPLDLAWHFAHYFPLVFVKFTTAFVFMAFLLSGLGIGPLREAAARYVFWAAILYKGIVQNSAWICVLVFALTTYMKSDASLVASYPQGLFTSLAATIPTAKADEDKSMLSMFLPPILGFAVFCMGPALLMLDLPSPALIDKKLMMLIGATTLVAHLLYLLYLVVRRRQMVGLLACAVSCIGFYALFPTESDARGITLNASKLSGVNASLSDIPLYGHPVQCPEAQVHRNLRFGGVLPSRDGDFYLLNPRYSVAEAEAPWPISMPFPARLEEAIVKVAKDLPKEMPSWLRLMLLHASVRDENIGQFFEHAKFKDSASVYGTTSKLAYIYSMTATRTTNDDLRGHTWWVSAAQDDALAFSALPTKNFTPQCPPPNMWVSLPLHHASVALVLAALIGNAVARNIDAKRKKLKKI